MNKKFKSFILFLLFFIEATSVSGFGENEKKITETFRLRSNSSEQFLRLLRGNGSYEKDKSSLKPSQEQKDALLQNALIGLGIFVAITIFSTYYDVNSEKANSVYTSFSLKRNVPSLLEVNAKPSQYACIDGMRAITQLENILFHYYYFSGGLVKTFYNPHALNEYFRSIWFYFLGHIQFGPDTFFVLSGMCLMLSFLKARSKGEEFNIFKFYVHRLVRLTPVYLSCIVLSIIIHDLPSGPIMLDTGSPLIEDHCRKHWLKSITYLNELDFHEICIPPSWYLNVDMKLFYLSPLILFAFWKYGYKASVIVIAAVLNSVYQTYSAVLNHNITFEQVKHFHLKAVNLIFIPVQIRGGPWFVGILAGYIVYQKWNLSKKLVKYIWIAVCCYLFMAVAGPYLVLEMKLVEMKPVELIPTSRVMWSICMAWVVFACVHGHGGWLNWFLSLPTWQILGKLSYVAYLIHLPIMVYLAKTREQPVFFDNFTYLFMGLGIYLFSIIIAVPWSSMFELPFIHLETEFWKYWDRNMKSSKKDNTVNFNQKSSIKTE